MKVKIGSLLLGIWLIGQGLLPLLGIGFTYQYHVFAILGIVAGVFLVINR